jgi:hypothetical protein
MSGSDLLAALEPVLAVLNRLGVRHFVGGSVASSAHGVARASLDVDVVAELAPGHVATLVGALQNAFFVDEGRVRAAVTAGRSFNLIHLATMFKVDVFVSHGRPFDASSFARARVEHLSQDPAATGIPLASAEDVLLAKLEWFRKGGESSERQWEDVKGLLRVGAAALDTAYLRHWATLLGVSDLLDRAFRESA